MTWASNVMMLISRTRFLDNDSSGKKTLLDSDKYLFSMEVASVSLFHKNKSFFLFFSELTLF